MKTRNFKTRKIDIFPQGLTHSFSQKMAIFPTCFFFAIQARKMSFTIFQREKTFSQAMKTRGSKSRKIFVFFKRVNARFLSKNGQFSKFSFLGNRGQENVFYHILERRNAFLGHRNKEFKKSKICHFSTGVNPWFWSKKGHFFKLFFLGNIGQDNVFYDILERKNAFLGHKKKNLKKSENFPFFQRG